MIEINNQTKSRINIKKINKTVELFLHKYHKQNHDVSIAFISEKEMKKFNKIYRGKDATTDILSFREEDGKLDKQKKYLGEILIDYKQIKKQAKENGQSAENELIFILVHGLLHLVGRDDETEKDKVKIIKLGEKFIKSEFKKK
jgi:probable rRNA maturation factor